MVNRNDNLNDLTTSLAEIRSRTEALKQQVNAFQPEFSQTLKKLTQDFWKIRLHIEEVLKNLDVEENRSSLQAKDRN